MNKPQLWSSGAIAWKSSYCIIPKHHTQSCCFYYKMHSLIRIIWLLLFHISLLNVPHLKLYSPSYCSQFIYNLMISQVPKSLDIFAYFLIVWSSIQLCPHPTMFKVSFITLQFPPDSCILLRLYLLLKTIFYPSMSSCSAISGHDFKSSNCLKIQDNGF